MSTNKTKQNLRYKKTSERLNKKVRYDGLSKDEVKYIKSKKQYEQIEKDLNNFWTTAPRKQNNSVDWESMSESELNYFDYIYKESEKLLKTLSKLEDTIDVDKTLNIFLQLNCKSASY
ncbi:hypothetical protein [Clostridium botulinum]|uniref:hypothetical protein n=1 Tax=Clostridium botulinum TaxID=1491 RepID=UPI00174998BA|nr:hypothetical protein [Clostridium botulinum]MBD5589123.1 hypothetical protein [Clostridium botulinum]